MLLSATLGAQPTRGFWLTNIDSPVYFEEGGPQRVVDACIQYGFNTIYAVTWNGGYTLYPSALMERTFGRRMDPALKGRDVLRELIDLAKPRGIRIIAWFEFGFASSYREEDGGELLRRKPSWAARDREGRVVSKNGFQWMNAFDPEVQQFMMDLVKEFAMQYAVDGIQGDDRLPALPSTSGYDPFTTARYREEHQGVDPPADYRDTAWVQWRADRLSDFMRRFYFVVKAIRPGLVVSSSPSIFPWSKEEYLQDWPTWLRNGWVDEVIPQIYRYQSDRYRYELDQIVRNQVAPAHLSRVVPGILLKVADHLAGETLLGEMISANRLAGFEGEVFFFFEGISPRSTFFSTLYPR